MASENEIFSHSGPVYLNAVNWRNPHHRRSVAASLVQAVYILERDRLAKRHGPQALAPPWWGFFHFELRTVLKDGSTIFGALFELKSQASYYHYSVQGAPKYVIAFRGTLQKLGTIGEDIWLNFLVTCNSLFQGKRPQIAMQAVQDMVAIAGRESIWLAGHSLGSAIALYAGRNMVRRHCFLETYLFNPPFADVPVERITNQYLKGAIGLALSGIKTGLAVVANGLRGQRPQQDDPLFAVLSPWVPYLFVNPSDCICCEYIRYFEDRNRKAAIVPDGIGRLAAQTSTLSLLLGALGQDSEPLHLLPSAFLTTNLSPSPDFGKAHGIHQWWRPDFYFQSKFYQFR